MSNSVGPRLRLLRNSLQARSISTSEPFGLPTGSLTVMSLIAANPGSSQVQLAEWAGITGPGLVGIIDDLEQRGLVKRERSPTDRRKNLLVLTDEGELKMETLFGEVSEIEAPIRNELGPQDFQRFMEMVDRAVAALDRQKS